MFHYYVGLDLGQSNDYTALCVIEEPLWIGPEIDWDAFGVVIPEGVGEGWVSPAGLSARTAQNVRWFNHHHGRPAHPPLHLRHLERFELGTKYTAIVERVRRLLLSPPLRQRIPHTALLVDKTGVGAAVVDSFEQAGVNPLSVTIHGGSAVTAEHQGFRVPKRDLVAAVQTLLQNGRLKVAGGLGLAPTLKAELLNFRVKVDPKTAHDSYEHWRENDHDDLVLSTALACWYREYVNRESEAQNARGGPHVAGGTDEYARHERRENRHG